MSSIAIVGAGVVGQATGKGLLHFGHRVVFSDIRELVLEQLTAGGYVATQPEQLRDTQTDVTMVCVGTPTVNGGIDLSQLDSVMDTVAMTLKDTDRYHLIVNRCTLPPCTTEDVVIPGLEQRSGKRVGRDFGVCHNPEFLREASAYEDFVKPWLIVFGSYDHRSSQALRELYGPISEETDTAIVETDLRTAEMLKYASNLYNATKISFTNEIWAACSQLGVDGNAVMSIVSRAAEGMWNPTYGTRGGFPYGGSCLPKDTAAFLRFASVRGFDMRLLQAVIDVNDRVAKREADPVAAAG